LEYKANGCGIYSSIDYPNIKRKIMLASLGKAFGLTGGVIASDLFISKLQKTRFCVERRNESRFCPNNDANQIYIRQHQKKDNLEYLNDHLVESKAFSL
jgi:hypothetical protein